MMFWLSARGAEKHRQKRGGGADGYIRNFKPDVFRWVVPDCTACLHR